MLAALGTFGHNVDAGFIIILNQLRVFGCWHQLKFFWNELHQVVSIPKLKQFSSSVPPCLLCHVHLNCSVFCCLSFFPFGCFFFEQAIDRHSSFASTVPSLDDDLEHNIWNRLAL